MASIMVTRRPSSPSLAWFSPCLSLPGAISSLLAPIFILSLLLQQLSPFSLAASHFEGFEADEDDLAVEDETLHLTTALPPLLTPTLTQSDSESHSKQPSDSNPNTPRRSSDESSDSPIKPSTTSFEFWDEDEFEGIPQQQAPQPPPESKSSENASSKSDPTENPRPTISRPPQSYNVEIICGAFLIMFAINFFTGKRQNENIALAWAAKFAIKDSIFEKNFSLLGVGSGKDDDSPLLLKEGQNVFRFYASGRRFCQGLLATLELQSRHDLISRLFNMVVPCKDEITIEVFMNDDAMDYVIFAVAKKKAAKAMQKEVRDLQRFASLVSPPSNKKWVPEDLGVVSESKEVAGDLITETVLDQVFGEKAYEKYGKGFISMHFSDQYMGVNKKMLVFKFALPDVNHMDEMARLVALVPYYIDLIGRYKLSSQAHSKTEAARQKAALEVYKELQNARQEALQKKKAERRKQMEEADAKLSAEALRKKEAKERARQMKKAMPKVKMTRAH